MKIMKNLVVMLLVCLSIASAAYAANDDNQAKINKLKAEIAAKGLDSAIAEAIAQGMDISVIVSTAVEAGKAQESVAQSVLSAAKAQNLNITSTVTSLASSGIGLTLIASAAVNTGYTPAVVTNSVVTAANTLNMNPNTAIASLSQAGIAHSVIAQETGKTTEQIASIASSAGQNDNKNQSGQKDQGLGFGDDPALGGEGANPNTPPGNPGAIGGGTIGGGGQTPSVSPSAP